MTTLTPEEEEYADSILTRTEAEWIAWFRRICSTETYAKAWGEATFAHAHRLLKEEGRAAFVGRINRPGSFLEYFSECAMMGRHPLFGTPPRSRLVPF